MRVDDVDAVPVADRGVNGEQDVLAHHLVDLVAADAAAGAGDDAADGVAAAAIAVGHGVPYSAQDGRPVERGPTADEMHDARTAMATQFLVEDARRRAASLRPLKMAAFFKRYLRENNNVTEALIGTVRAFQKRVAKAKAELASGALEARFRKRGRPAALDNLWRLYEKNLIDAQRHFGQLHRGQLIVEAAHTITQAYLANLITKEDAINRLTRIHTKQWFKWPKPSFIRPYFAKVSSTRPYDTARALKNQPEFLLIYYRMIIGAHAIVQITETIRCGTIVENWCIPRGEVIARRTDSVEVHGELAGSDDIGDDLLGYEPSTGDIIVKPLRARLRFADPERVFNLDEKPLYVDSVVLNGFAAQALSPGSSDRWTVTPLVNAAGALLGAQILVRGEPLGVGGDDSQRSVPLWCVHGLTQWQQGLRERAQKWSKRFYVDLEAKGSQTNGSMLRLVHELIQPAVYGSCEINRGRPAILLLDGAIMHLNPAVRRELRNLGVLTVCMPSHSTTMCQPLDNGFMALLDTDYKKTSTSWLATNDGAFDNAAKLVCVLRSLVEVGGKASKVIKGGFRFCGLPDGRVDPSFKPQQFRLGATLRDPTLPNVTKTLLEQLMARRSLARPPFEPPVVVLHLIRLSGQGDNATARALSEQLLNAAVAAQEKLQLATTAATPPPQPKNDDDDDVDDKLIDNEDEDEQTEEVLLQSEPPPPPPTAVLRVADEEDNSAGDEYLPLLDEREEIATIAEEDNSLPDPTLRDVSLVSYIIRFKKQVLGEGRFKKLMFGVRRDVVVRRLSDVGKLYRDIAKSSGNDNANDDNDDDIDDNDEEEDELMVDRIATRGSLGKKKVIIPTYAGAVLWPEASVRAAERAAEQQEREEVVAAEAAAKRSEQSRDEKPLLDALIESGDIEENTPRLTLEMLKRALDVRVQLYRLYYKTASGNRGIPSGLRRHEYLEQLEKLRVQHPAEFAVAGSIRCSGCALLQHTNYVFNEWSKCDAAVDCSTFWCSDCQYRTPNGSRKNPNATTSLPEHRELCLSSVERHQRSVAAAEAAHGRDGRSLFSSSSTTTTTTTTTAAAAVVAAATDDGSASIARTSSLSSATTIATSDSFNRGRLEHALSTPLQRPTPVVRDRQQQQQQPRAEQPQKKQRRFE